MGPFPTRQAPVGAPYALMSVTVHASHPGRSNRVTGLSADKVERRKRQRRRRAATGGGAGLYRAAVRLPRQRAAPAEGLPVPARAHARAVDAGAAAPHADPLRRRHSARVRVPGAATWLHRRVISSALEAMLVSAWARRTAHVQCTRASALALAPLVPRLPPQRRRAPLKLCALRPLVAPETPGAAQCWRAARAARR